MLVPFPGAADNHQLRNAEVLDRVGAAKLREQADDELMTSFLFSDLSGLLVAREVRAEMGRKARALAHPDAVREIVSMVVELARRV